MAKARKRSRLILSGLVALLIGAALVIAFWPRPVMVDLGAVTRGPMMVTIDEEGRTRVAEAYVVSTPVAGRLQRVQVHPGDPVVQDQTVVAHMLPTNPAALDVRTREQAQAALQAAEAALRVARADLNAALANRDLAESELDRARQLSERQIASKAAFDRARQNFRVAEATVETAEAAIAIREADLANARAQLIGFDDQGLARAIGNTRSDDIPLYAPADGRILRILQESATTLPAGAPIMEIGDVDGSLEVVVDLISSDAVQVAPGDPVLIADWGGPDTLPGEVRRVDPFGVTTFSALGVEEQRVAVTIAMTGPKEARRALGHGYRVEARIIVWQNEDALRVPASALFRDGAGWAVFRDTEGRAGLSPVEIGQNNGVTAEVLDGLSAGDRVVLYPSAAISDGMAIAERSIE
ncbi:Putative efflux system component YknX [Roseivivax sp. THAF40]|uniref:efflux RND transporter periplasmic adaptor subunit n=1 Tax=unclassified Roseivivax TaxID=2639302 RepID=UPI001268D145|nr:MULTISPECIES: HlyD family efflux transporter periplasmic adaptor subunit [unclassified Roseivivax]QFS82573.1 Putative efflux system component YknX [Roseivivax sp. THAF197b]QFT46342.1 Putative efflux system component YknX [Roseivivax sp. THAF40]